MKKKLVFAFLLSLPFITYSQENLTADELFSKARTVAFEEKNYAESIKLAKEALLKAPNYTDISIFLGRLYTWSDEIANARTLFTELENKDVNDEDFYMAYASLEYWNDDYEKALIILNKGLEKHPQSEDLLLLKAKVFYSNNGYAESETTLNTLLQIQKLVLYLAE